MKIVKIIKTNLTRIWIFCKNFRLLFFFEYLASGKPILGIGPVNGDAAEILNQTKAGVIVERTDAIGIKAALLAYYQNWKAGITVTSSASDKYSREQLTSALTKLLEDL